MEGSQYGWWRRHGWTVAILLGAIGIAFAIRTIWTYPIIQQFGPLYTYAGGSDSYYHSRVTTFIITNHANLVFDPMIHFPVGGYNPREPLFDWMNAILGLVFAPFFGGNAVVAGAWFLDLQGPLWAALEIIPVYLIGREISSKRMGLIAAIIFPFLSANIDSSIFGYANYLSFYTFIILVTIYAYIRTVKAVGSRRWIANYRDPKQYLPGLRAFLRTERTAVKWAVFTGVSMGALALAWQGYTYAIVVIGLTLVIAMIIERLRRIDSFGLYVTTAIVGLVGFPMAVPYYLVQHQFSAWFDLPLLLFFGTLALMLPFLLMRDIPWVFSIPTLVGLVLVAALFLFFIEPRYFTSIVTGQGYFVKNLIYSTVAEAQAPSIDQLVVGYGVVTFFLAFAGVALFVWALIRQRFKRQHIVFLIFAVLSIYLPISAAKFFLLGSPAFALLPAEAIERALDVGGYPTLRRTVASLSDRGSQFAAFRKAFKARHVLIFLLIVAIVLPNVWVGIDAGIPGNTKTGFSDQVYDSLPTWLRGNSSTATNYFGAAGTSLDTSNLYDSAGYSWLATQDTNVPAANRPAFVSWWDYGFQAIDQGQHPSVADNFQNGIDPAGQFLLAQNESNAIGVLATTLLQAEQLASGEKYLPASLNVILARDGLNVSRLHSYMTNESADYNAVVANPDVYLPVNPSTLTDDNAMYLVMSHFIATSQTLSGVATIYNDIQLYTGWSIRYDMVDSRLIPFSGQDTGIYYAPADLTGRVINGAGLPTSFFNVTVLGSDGNYYPLGSVPADVSPVNYYVNYFAPFYNSLIYRTYFGYNGTDIGQSAGIPGLEGGVASDPVEPGWMLEHFAVVYQTAYYCAPGSGATNCSSGGVAMNSPSARSLAASSGGQANLSAYQYFSGGESMLEYYPGQTLLGDLQLPNGAPIGGDRVTVFDQWGVPHESVVTAPDGSFSLVLPPGNDTLNITTGALQGLTQQGATLLKTLHLYVPPSVALSFNAPNLPETIVLGGSTVHGFVYWNVANGTSYEPTQDPVVSGASVVLWGPNNVSRLVTTTDASGAFQFTNVAPGTYNYDILYGGYNYSQTALTIEPPPAEQENSSVGLTATSVQGTVDGPGGVPITGARIVLSNATGSVVTNTSGANGTYSLRTFPPGNYSLTASVPTASEQSATIPVSFATEATVLEQNLTVRPVTTASVSVVAGGSPVAGVPVDFTPYPSFANASVEPIGAYESALGNGSVALTNAAGVATIALPYANYTVTVLARVGGTLSTAVGSLVASALAPGPTLTLALAPAVRLSGTVATEDPSEEPATAVTAYTPSGVPVSAWAVNGSFALYLPAATYNLSVVQGINEPNSENFAALTRVSLVPGTTVSLVPSSAIELSATVGSTTASGTLAPAVGAQVTISAGTAAGPSVTVLASPAGVAAAYVPSALPSPAFSYCVSVVATGYSGSNQCGLSPGALAGITSLPISLRPVPVTIRVLGDPANVLRVNATATSATAVTTALLGGPTFSTALAPGSYALSGWAPTGNATTVYRSTSTVNFTVPIGGTSASVSLVLTTLKNSTGTVSVPSGGTLASASIGLSSPTFNVTVNGTAYTDGFYVAPGAYTAHASVTVGSSTYASLTPVVVSAGGKVSPALAIGTAGVDLTGTLERSANVALAVNTTAVLTGKDGTTISIAVSGGKFSVLVPADTVYAVTASATTRELGSAGVYTAAWTAATGSSCTAGYNTSSCGVTMVPAPQPVYLNGTLTASGVPGAIAGNLTFFGPYPSTAATTVSAPTGAFSVALAPGDYSVYVTGGGASSPLADLTTVPVSLSSPGVVTFALSPAWTATIGVAAPSGAAPLLGPANVTVTSSLGARIAFPGVATGTPIELALPVGAYVAAATSFGTPYGVTSNASATMPVSILHGNVGATLALSYVYSYAVSAAVTGSATATVAAPGSASFAFSIRAIGNSPVTVHAVGSPASWGFSYSFTSVTLNPGGGSAPYAASMTVQIPAGASALEPNGQVQIELANGTVVGSFSFQIVVVPVYGVLVVSAGAPVDSPTSASVPFYLVNTGNTVETVDLTVVDLARIEGQGWSVGFTTSGSSVNGTAISLTPFENSTYDVSLTAAAPVFVVPGSVTVQASVTNHSGAYQSFVALPIPVASLAPHTSNGTNPLTVTGPVLGTPPPSSPAWLVPLLSFVPAIALVVGVLTYRWWRTRRWTRR
ncbi:MAG TPA: carboxypeptidase regulatory-like domain-containing protein [Thermoplasmata archaeon]|nr:carboxypeptidase regulatory-like domain-containing protein [Thermoplasmata archaeon]